MRAVKCDLCGKLYEYNEIDKKFDLAEVGDSVYLHHLDLCDDCQNDLIKWIEEKKLETTKNHE